MNLAEVVGTVVATVKDPPLKGRRLLLIAPIQRDGRRSGPLRVALDSVGAGPGERVFYVSGKEGSFPWFPELVPSDCSIVGILDPGNFSEPEQ